jgi:uncharacterized protein
MPRARLDPGTTAHNDTTAHTPRPRSLRGAGCGGCPGRSPQRDTPGSTHKTARRRRGRPHTRQVRITIRVRPGSSRPGVGGGHGDALVVRVSARAVDGKATEAALAAVAAAFGVRRDAVTLVAGASSRTKIVDVAAGDPGLLAELLAGPPS